MPAHNNTLQTIPTELLIQIHHSAASLDQPFKPLTVFGSKLLHAHETGEHAGVLPVQLAAAAATTLHPLSLTCRKLYSDLPPWIAAAPFPFAYHFVVNNFDIDQLDLFRQFTKCPMNCSRDFSLRFQFDSGVVASALELETAISWGGVGFFPSKIEKFMLLFMPRHCRGGKRSSVGMMDFGVGGGDGDRELDGDAMTEQQARDTVEILRRIRRLSEIKNAAIVGRIAIRFETMLDMYVGRRDGRSDVWRGEDEESRIFSTRIPLPAKKEKKERKCFGLGSCL